MGRCRFVQPAVVRLPLSDGEFIDVKKELTAGEERRIFSGLVKEHRAGESALLDSEQVGKTKLLEYLVAWSLVGPDGQPEPVSAAAIDNLDMDTYREISQAIEAHDAAVELERAARKNGQDGERKLPATSPSPSAVAGASSGSVN